MSLQITTAFVQQFQDNIILLAQQKGSRLRDRVLEKMVTGDAAYFERIGPTNAQVRTTRHGNSPQVDTPHSRRRVTMADYEWGDLIDKQDEVRMLIDPQSAYALNAGYAMGRAIDDILLNAATGTSVSVTSSLNATTSNVAFATGNVVSVSFGTTNSNLTVPKLIEGRRILMANNIDMDEEMTVVTNASAMANLLNTTQVTSADYNTVKTLVNGDIDTFMGFKFVHTERLLGVTASSSNPIQTLAFSRSALGLAVGMDVVTRIEERADKSFATYVYAMMSLGAIRVEEEKIVQLNCYQ